MANLKTLVIQGPSGLWYATSSRLAYANIITVKRNGQRQYPVEAPPTGPVPDFYYDASLGRLTFSRDLVFNETALNPDGSRIIELVHVIYTAGDGTIIDTPPITLNK